MLVDEYEQYHNNNDKTDVVVVSRSGSEEEPEPEPSADDRMFCNPNESRQNSYPSQSCYTLTLSWREARLLSFPPEAGCVPSSERYANLVHINRPGNDGALFAKRP